MNTINTTYCSTSQLDGDITKTPFQSDTRCSKVVQKEASNILSTQSSLVEISPSSAYLNRIYNVAESIQAPIALLAEKTVCYKVLQTVRNYEISKLKLEVQENENPISYRKIIEVGMEHLAEEASCLISHPLINLSSRCLLALPRTQKERALLELIYPVLAQFAQDHSGKIFLGVIGKACLSSACVWAERQNKSLLSATLDTLASIPTGGFISAGVGLLVAKATFPIFAKTVSKFSENSLKENILKKILEASKDQDLYSQDEWKIIVCKVVEELFTDKYFL